MRVKLAPAANALRHEAARHSFDGTSFAAQPAPPNVDPSALNFDPPADPPPPPNTRNERHENAPLRPHLWPWVLISGEGSGKQRRAVEGFGRQGWAGPLDDR